MASKAGKAKTVPNGSGEGFQPRLVIKASPRASAHLKRMQDEALAREMEATRREGVRADRVDTERHLEAVTARAAVGGEDVERAGRGPVAVISRDGLEWLKRRQVLGPVHYDAGLRFRTSYERANGTGVQSCLAGEGAHGVMGPKSGPTDAMLRARDDMKEALRSLGTPMLHAYVKLIAGEGVMLTDGRFVKDAREASAHHLPCRIAFDLLARYYGLIR